MSTPEWTVLFVLPQLRIEQKAAADVGLSLGLEGLAIVPLQDSRVEEYCSWSSVAAQFLNSFSTNYGELHRPSVLLIHESWLARFRHDVEPIIAFRNSVAMACVCQSRADRGWGMPWTDYFDFHPAMVALDGSQVDLVTPALTSISVPLDGLSLTLDPGLPLEDYRHLDENLAAWLGRAWRDTYWARRCVGPGRRLFRSLEVAYLAASFRSRNFSSLQEVGIGAVLWVSAVEILASPPSRKVQRLDGVDLVSSYRWDYRAELRRRRYRILVNRKKGTTRNVNLAAKLYERLYSARSKFVHGDNVSPCLLRSLPRPGAPPLLRFASSVYRTAALAYLMRHWTSSS